METSNGRFDFDVKEWSRGDPFPKLGSEVAIDTETELITDSCHVPPLVVTGMFNPEDNTCYIASWRDTPEFMQEVLKRDCTIYFANAGFDYYELWSKELQQAAQDRRVIDVLIRGALKEISTIGFIRTYSLVDACKWHIGYAMNKHEDEGDKAARVTFRRGTPVTDEQKIYLGIDCAATYLCAKAIGPMATEDTHTLGQIVLSHISNNGIKADMEVFDACEKLLKEEKEKYRQQLLSYGFPDPCKKEEKSDWDILKENWRSFLIGFFAKFYNEKYDFPFSIPSKAVCKRLLLYGLELTKEGRDRSDLARLLTVILMQGKKTLSKKETAVWDELTEKEEWLVPCDVSRRAAVWPLLLHTFLNVMMTAEKWGEPAYEQALEAMEKCAEEHPEWYTDEEPVKPTDFLQEKLNSIEKEHPGMSFARTPKTGLLKCSKKDQWLLDDFKVKDPFLDAYNSFVHVQKYLSTFCNRKLIRSDGKVHARFGIVASGRTSCTGPNI